MEHTVETVSPTKRKITVSVPASEVNSTMDATVRNLGRNVSLDGFRKGKVPASVIEKRFKEDVVMRSTDTLVNQQIQAVLDKEGLKPVNRMQFDGGQAARNEDFSFNVSFEVLPEIELPENLDELSVEVEEAVVTDEDAESLLDRLRKSMGGLEPVTEERVAQYGDVVVIDVAGEVDGKDVPGMKTDDFMMQLTEPKGDAKEGEVEAVVRTLKVGETGKGTMTLAEDHPDADMRGKDAHFKVTLKAINKEVLPEVDDDMARKMGFDSADKFKQAVHEHALNGKVLEIKRKGQQKLMESLLDKQDFPLPESLVETNLNAFLGEARDRMMRQGISGDQLNKALEDMREEGMVQARMQAKSQAFLLALGQKLGIRISQMDIDRHIQQVAMESNQDYAQLREAIYNNGMANDLEDRLMASRALELMYAKANKITVDKDGNPVEKSGDGAEPSNKEGKTKKTAKKAAETGKSAD